VSVCVDIRATRERVWRALTAPEEVAQWDGATPVRVPDGYPHVGQHALWRVRFGPFPVTLHDHVEVVEERRVLGAALAVSFVRLSERYTLEQIPDGTRLVSDNQVSAAIAGLGRLALRLTQRNVESSMARLRSFCEQD
jgi:hypothetical protein